MYLKKSIRKKTGRVYLVIAQKYRDAKTGKSTDRTIKSIGYLDELENEYEDPIAYFKEFARKMTEDEKKDKYVSFKIDMNEQLTDQSEGTKNFGYAVPLKVYYDLELHELIKNAARNNNITTNLNSVIILLTIVRLLSPGTQKRAYDERELFFERFDFPLEDVYNALTFFDKISVELQHHMHTKIQQKYNRDTNVVYYSKNDYFFERYLDDLIHYTDKPMNSRHMPVIQMGCIFDSDCVPINYSLCNGSLYGSLLDRETFRTSIKNMINNYTEKRSVIVANRGIITDDCVRYFVQNNFFNDKVGYIFGLPTQGWSSELRTYILDNYGFRDKSGAPATDSSDFKIKSCISRKSVITSNERTKKQVVGNYDERQIVFWSKKLFDKTKSDRAEIIAKAEDIIKNPDKYNQITTGTAAQYIKNIRFDKSTGKIIKVKEGSLTLNKNQINKEEKYDGYSLIVTSEMDLTAVEIVEKYSKLNDIENVCNIVRNDLIFRRVYAKDNDHVKAHFLIYYIALSILQLIIKKTGNKYGASDIIECLNRIECMHEMNDTFLFAFKNEVSEALSRAFDIDFSKKRLTLNQINKMLNDIKKNV